MYVTHLRVLLKAWTVAIPQVDLAKKKLATEAQIHLYSVTVAKKIHKIKEMVDFRKHVSKLVIGDGATLTELPLETRNSKYWSKPTKKHQSLFKSRKKWNNSFMLMADAHNKFKIIKKKKKKKK